MTAISRWLSAATPPEPGFSPFIPILEGSQRLAKFAIALQNGKLLKAETLTQMATRQKLKDGKEINYGLGWTVDPTGAPAHGGAQQGNSTFLLVDRRPNVSVAVMANSEGVGQALSRLAVQFADIAAAAP